jgi:methylated-DNA-[protein]-cysteine S-methyltransferase
MSAATIAPAVVSARHIPAAHTSSNEVPRFVRRMNTPIGRIEIESDGEAITSLSIETGGHLPSDGVPESPIPLLERAVEQLDEYFRGERTSFDLPIVTNGSPFQQAVWREIAEIGFGSTRSYGTLGLATGRATAGRAVGGAVGANPIPIIVPCHRVLASNGRITGYSGGDGIPTKQWLLDHEGITHR